MARLEDIPQPSRDSVIAAPCPAFETQPFVESIRIPGVPGDGWPGRR